MQHIRFRHKYWIILNVMWRRWICRLYRHSNWIDLRNKRKRTKKRKNSTENVNNNYHLLLNLLLCNVHDNRKPVALDWKLFWKNHFTRSFCSQCCQTFIINIFVYIFTNAKLAKLFLQCGINYLICLLLFLFQLTINKNCESKRKDVDIWSDEKK